MIESDFSYAEGPKTIRFSEGQFETAAETFDDVAGNGLFGVKPVLQQFAMRAQHAGYSLHGVDAGAQGARTLALVVFSNSDGKE